MLIRSAREDDYAPLLALLRELNPDDPPATAVTQDVFAQILAAPHLVLLVAERKGALAGSCYLNLIPNLTRGAQPYAVLENVVTAAAQRRQGVGQALIRDALERAWAAGCYKVMLQSGRKDPAVHAFYRACGFSPDAKQAYIVRAPT